MQAKVASGAGYGAIGGATSALIAPYLVSAGGGAANLTDGQRAAIAGMSTLLGGLTAGLAGQNAQAGAAAAENEVLNNSLGDHRTEAQKEQDEQKEELSQERAKLSGGQEIIGYDAEGNPEYAVKPPPSLFGLAGSPGSNQGASGNTARVGGGSAFAVDVGNGANDWNDGVMNTTSGTTPMINGVTVVDQRTGAVYQGTVDLQPTLDRIASGGTPLSRNDGTVFQNRPVNGVSLLPVQPPGYYTEYVVPTPGISGPGPQRIVTGQGGEVYYTPDHYQSFVPVKK